MGLTHRPFLPVIFLYTSRKGAKIDNHFHIMFQISDPVFGVKTVNLDFWGFFTFFDRFLTIFWSFFDRSWNDRSSSPIAPPTHFCVARWAAYACALLHMHQVAECNLCSRTPKHTRTNTMTSEHMHRSIENCVRWAHLYKSYQRSHPVPSILSLTDDYIYGDTLRYAESVPYRRWCASQLRQ